MRLAPIGGPVLHARANDLTMRHVQVARRFERSVFVRSALVPKGQQLTAVLLDIESQPRKEARTNAR